jgi:hypothetical protein
MRRFLLFIALPMMTLGVLAVFTVVVGEDEAAAVECDPTSESTPEFSELYDRITEEALKIESYAIDAKLWVRIPGNPPHLLSTSLTRSDERARIYMQQVTHYRAGGESRLEVYGDESRDVRFSRAIGGEWQGGPQGETRGSESSPPWDCQPIAEKLLPLEYGDSPELLRVRSVYRSRDAEFSDLHIDFYIDRTALQPAKKVLNWTRDWVGEDGNKVTLRYHQECEFSALNVPFLIPADLPAY